MILLRPINAVAQFGVVGRAPRGPGHRLDLCEFPGPASPGDAHPLRSIDGAASMIEEGARCRLAVWAAGEAVALPAAAQSARLCRVAELFRLGSPSELAQPIFEVIDCWSTE